MTNHFRVYQVYDRLIRRALLFAGLWPIANPNILYRLLPFAHGLGMILMICVVINYCRHNIHDVDLFLKGLGLIMSCFTMIQKLICFTIYRKTLVELHATLKETFGQDYQDTELRPILLSPVTRFYRPSLTLSVFMWMLTVIWWIKPVVAIIIQLSRRVEHLKLFLPYPAVYPFRTDSSYWLYTILFIFEMYSGISITSVTSAVDSLFGYYIFQMSGQLRTLSHRIRNLRSSENYQKVISECVTRHEILIRCQGHLEQIYGPIVLWMLLTSAVVMGCLIYQASHMTPAKAAHFAIYIIMKLIQTLHYGWFGTSLTMENDSFREEIYASDWPGSGDRRLMTNVLLMMSYKPSPLRACTISTISVEMFVAVSNTTMSYFALIRTLDEGNQS